MLQRTSQRRSRTCCYFEKQVIMKGEGRKQLERDITTFAFKGICNKPLLEKLLSISFAFYHKDMHCLWFCFIKFDLLPLNCKSTFPQMYGHLNLRTQHISVTSYINCEQLLAKRLIKYYNARFRKRNTPWVLYHLQEQRSLILSLSLKQNVTSVY